jgi:hypothetical protein
MKLDLTNKTPKEKSNLKADAIFSAIQKGKIKRSKYNIEIVDTNKIDGGIEVFARAWNGKKQIGFGVDGSVDIERFRFFNPPILVDDPAGDIIISETNEDGETTIRTLREDPEEALLQGLSDAICLSGKNGDKIIADKRGSTVDTYYATTDDGHVDVDGAASWSAAHDATSGTANNTYTSDDNVLHSSKIGAAYYVRRAQYPFDTSAIGTDTINSAILSLYSTASGGNNTDGYNLVLLNHTANINVNNPLANEDFNDFSSTSIGTLAMSSAVNQNAYISVTLTDTSVVNGSGITLIGVRISGDISNTTPTGTNNFRSRQADYTGTSYDPKIVIDHSAGGGGATTNPEFLLNFMGI